MAVYRYSGHDEPVDLSFVVAGALYMAFYGFMGLRMGFEVPGRLFSRGRRDACMLHVHAMRLFANVTRSIEYVLRSTKYVQLCSRMCSARLPVYRRLLCSCGDSHSSSRRTLPATAQHSYATCLLVTTATPLQDDHMLLPSTQ